MTVLEAILLGFVQGATEFLPVSSSGHLVIGQALLGLRLPGVTFEVAVHAGTLLSIMVAYRARISGLASGALRGERSAWRYIGLVLLGTLPATLVALLLGDVVDAAFSSLWIPGVGLLVTGFLLWSTRAALRRSPDALLSPGLALAIGVAQALAITPGVSRSGTTVVVALWLGLRSEEAAEFSFMLAIPAIAGAVLLELPAFRSAAAGGGEGILLVVGAVTAGLTGILAIRAFLAFLKREAFHHFALYCWAVGASYLLYLILSGGVA